MKPYQIPINGTWIDLESITSIGTIQINCGLGTAKFNIYCKFHSEPIKIHCSPEDNFTFESDYEFDMEVYNASLEQIYNPLLTEWQKLGE